MRLHHASIPRVWKLRPRELKSFGSWEGAWLGYRPLVCLILEPVPYPCHFPASSWKKEECVSSVGNVGKARREDQSGEEFV